MFIRYFASTDLHESTELGAAALAWTSFMLALDVPIRLVSARVTYVDLGTKSSWKAHRDLLLTPMEGPFVNVVCAEPEHWGRLWTANRRNVLLANSWPHVVDNIILKAARCYDALVVPAEIDIAAWHRWLDGEGGGSLHVLRPTADRLEDFRALLGLV